jgi:AraC family transcriptional regulator
VRGLIRSLDAHRYLKAAMTACSWDAGWRSLLLRAYDDPPEVEEITTPPTPDHLIVLVTGGSCNIEGRYRSRWHRAHYRAGSLGMTAPGEKVTLRWRGETRHQTLQLHLPAAVVTEALDELSRKYSRQPQMPYELLSEDDPVIQRMPLLSRCTSIHLIRLRFQCGSRRTFCGIAACGVPRWYAAKARHVR